MGQLGDFLYNAESADIQYYGADLLFKFRGFSLESELYHRNSDKGIITNAEDASQSNYVVSGKTFMIQSGYFLTRRKEIAIRYAHITPNSQIASIMKEQTEYVFGFSHYFNKHSLKLQSDLTYIENRLNSNLIYRLSAVCSF